MKWGFHNGLDIDSKGSCGGLCLGWKEGVSISLKSLSKNYIDVMVNDDSDNEPWRFTRFYRILFHNTKMDS